MSEMGLSFPITRLHQVALVVPDLDATVRAYADRLGLRPWSVYTYGPPVVQEMTYRGRRQDYRMRLAFARCGELQLEVIQPLAGPSIYDEFLARQPEGGLHHVAVLVPNLDAAVQAMETQGFAMIQSGRGYGVHGDGGYAYFQMPGPLAAILELIELPSERRPPERVYPPATGST